MRVLAFLPLLAAACAPAGAQQPAERDLFFGAGSCAAQACHGGGVAERQEYKIWATRDRHSKAFDSLSGDVGRRIGERLGIDPTKANECLACHGAPGAKTAATFDPHDGVSCELCHGPAGRWLGPHAAPGFKARLAVDKEQLGLLDLTSAEKRAARCVTCHVGGEGKDLTHTMMAAGHPPLVFSLPKFLAEMPPHWKTPPQPDAWWQGAKAVAAARLRQTARLADSGKDWPEFAAFDCYGCHREIGRGGGSGAKGRPGDLPLDVAALEVLVLADEDLGKRVQGILGAAYLPGAP
ncbi:MAG: multiheme c-type cytochrome, partial [Planctomycetota bacterium]